MANLRGAIGRGASPMIVLAFLSFLAPSQTALAFLQQGWFGSGVIISPDGYLLTNNHVVEGASALEVHLMSGEKFTASVIATLPDKDLAILKISGRKFPFLFLDLDREIKVGESVVSVGCPEGLVGTISTGIITGLHRNVKTERGELKDLYQTNAGIAPGSSGGPLIDVYGRVVGINVAVKTAKGVPLTEFGFAIPIRNAAGWIVANVPSLPSPSHSKVNLSVPELADISAPATVLIVAMIDLPLITILPKAISGYPLSEVTTWRPERSRVEALQHRSFSTGERLQYLDVPQKWLDRFRNVALGDIVEPLLDRGCTPPLSPYFGEGLGLDLALVLEWLSSGVLQHLVEIASLRLSPSGKPVVLYVVVAQFDSETVANTAVNFPLFQGQGTVARESVGIRGIEFPVVVNISMAEGYVLELISSGSLFPHAVGTDEVTPSAYVWNPVFYLQPPLTPPEPPQTPPKTPVTQLCVWRIAMALQLITARAFGNLFFAVSLTWGNSTKLDVVSEGPFGLPEVRRLRGKYSFSNGCVNLWLENEYTPKTVICLDQLLAEFKAVLNEAVAPLAEALGM